MSTDVVPVPDTTRSTSESIAILSARQDLAACHRITVLENLHEGTWNQFSCKVPGRPGHILLTPGMTHFSRVTAASLVELDPRGDAVEGDGQLNQSAWAIHHPIHMARPDIQCALHVHAPYSTALCSIEGWRFDDRGSQNAGVFFDNVAYFEYEGIVTAEEEGGRMVDALGDKRVLFMANHGVLVVADTIEKAMLFVYQLERACMNELLVYSSGRAINRIPVEAARHNAQLSEGVSSEAGYLEAMKDVLRAQGQDFES
ncbi:MAG: class II aldolase/adducin family protein [Gemmatimonadota bacterium]|nr:class II aldolase/adducin family protein [Gemmatimonadota bacterium]